MAEKEHQSSMFNIDPGGNETVRPKGILKKFKKEKKIKPAKEKKQKPDPSDRWSWTNQGDEK